MQIGTILDHVQRKIQDSSYERSPDLLSIINMGLGEIATEVVLPYLYKNDTVTCTADSFEVALPNDFYSNLIWAHNITKDYRVTTYSSLNIFLEQNSGLNKKGDVVEVCNHGNTLYYSPTPRDVSQTVRLWYCSTPTFYDLNGSESQEITWLPEHLQAPLLINYATMKVFEEIEEEQQSPNFDKYYNLFSQAKANLINFVGLPEAKPEFLPGQDDWEM